MIFATKIPTVVLIIILALAAVFAVFCAFNKSFRKAKIFRRIGIAALLLLALMRPAIGKAEIDRELSNLNIFFIVDVSGSMATRDMDSDTKFRYVKAAEDMKTIVKLFPGAKYSIITLDYNIYQAMPLIDNTDTAISYIDTMKPKNSYLSSDSTLTSLMDYSYKCIKRYTERFPERANVAIFLSDGEDSDNKTTIPSDFKNLLSGGAVIGYGTLTGSMVYRVDYDNEVEDTPLKDSATGSAHISKLNENNLKSVAESMGLPYYRRSSSNDKFDSNENFLNTKATYRRGENNMKVDNELYWIPMLFAIALLLFDFFKILESLLLERKAAK